MSHGAGWALGLLALAMFMLASPIHAQTDGSPRRFQILPLSEGGGGTAMYTLTCPAHRHGTPEEAMEKLHDLLADWPDDRPSTVWVCRANLLSTLEMFAPHVDQVVVNPFVHLQHDGAREGSIAAWENTDHPVINHLREVREAAGSTGVIGCLDLRGEPRYFDNRQASFQEIEWMIYAVIGANYQGLVWRYRGGQRDDLPWKDRLARLETQLQAESEGLGDAEPVDWVQTADDTPVSSLASDSRLYICLLHPDFMQLMPDGKSFQMPLEHEPANTDLALKLPPGVGIDEIRTLGGLPVMFQNEDGEVRLRHRLTGGGTMLVAHLRGNRTEAVTREEVGP